MNELIAISVFIIWYSLSLIVSEKYGKNSKPDIEWLFFISMILSPITGFLIAKFIASTDQKEKGRI